MFREESTIWCSPGSGVKVRGFLSFFSRCYFKIEVRITL